MTRAEHLEYAKTRARAKVDAGAGAPTAENPEEGNMFPTAGAQVYYNDAGEPTGWDYPGYDDPPNPDDFDNPDHDFDDERSDEEL